MNSPLYYVLIYKNEKNKIVTLKARPSYFFGTIEKVKKQQLFKLLAQRNNVDTTKTIVIHYQDTLKRIDEFPKTNKIVPTKNGHKHLVLTNLL